MRYLLLEKYTEVDHSDDTNDGESLYPDYNVDRREYPLDNLAHLRKRVKDMNIQVGKMSLQTVWGRKWKEYVGKTVDGYDAYMIYKES